MKRWFDSMQFAVLLTPALLFLGCAAPTASSGSGSGSVADDAADDDAAEIEFPTEGPALLTLSQGDDLQASFEGAAGAAADDADATVTRFIVTSADGDTQADFDDAGMVTGATAGEVSVAATYTGGESFAYEVMAGGSVALAGTATMSAFDESDFETVSKSVNDASRFQGTADSLGIAVASCVDSLRSGAAFDSVFACNREGTGITDDCYETCLQQNTEVTELLVSACVVAMVRGRLAAEEERACLEANDRPVSECARLAVTSERVRTYLQLLVSIVDDVAESFRSQDACPFGDVEGIDARCTSDRFRIIDQCPQLADDDMGDDGDIGDGGDMGDGGDGGDGMDGDGDGGEEIVCDQNSVPPDPNCFNIVNITDQGTASATSEFSADFHVSLGLDGDSSTSWFSDGDPEGEEPSESFFWQFGESEDIYLSGIETDPEQFEGGGRFGFGSVTVRVLDAAGVETFNSGPMTLPGSLVDFDLTFPDGTIGRAVQLILVGHQDPACGGFAELRVYGFELIETDDGE